MIAFTARCAKDHDPIEFEGAEGRDAFVAHMAQAHGRTTRRRTPAWISPTPHPWKPARRLPEAEYVRRLYGWMETPLTPYRLEHITPQVTTATWIGDNHTGEAA